MGNFFKSEIVRKELEEINQLQKRLQKVFLSMGSLTHEERVEFISLVKILIEKQEIMYFRMKLSDDEESQEMIDHIKQSAIALGISPTKTLEQMFKEMKESINRMLKGLDVSGDP